MKRSLEVGGTKSGWGASLLPVLDLPAGPWVMASSSSFLVGLTKVLTQGLRRVVRNPGAIAKVRIRCYFSKQAGWPIGYRAFKIEKWSTYRIILGWTKWEDDQLERKKVICRGYVTWLCKKHAKPGKMCNQPFLLD